MSMLLRASKTHSLLYTSHQRALGPIILKSHSITTTPRNQDSTSQQGTGGGSRRIGLKLALITLTGFGIGYGITKISSDFRKQVETNVPYSNVVLQQVDSFYDNFIQPFINPKLEVKPIPTPKTELTPIVPVKVETPTQTEPAIPVVNKAQLKPTAPPATKKATQTEASPISDQTVLESIKIDTKASSDWKQALKDHELQEEAAIKAIEAKLQNGISDVVAKVNDVAKSCQVSIETLKKYSESLKQALDDANEDSKDKQWQQVTHLFEKQAVESRNSNEKINTAKKAIFDLDRLLVDIKSSDSSKYVKNLKEIQLELIKQFRQLQFDKSKLSEATVHANVLRSYTHEQKLARDQFLKEIQSLQPEGIRGKLTDDQLSSEELNSLLIHAHKRVLQLQKQINKMQASENQHIQSALEEQRKLFDSLDKENVEAALNSQKREFELEKDRVAEDVKLLKEEEFKKELSRQAAAHNNHLTKMLKLQQEELESLYEKKMLIESEGIRKKFYDTVAVYVGRLKGIEHAIQARANLELQAQNAKQLWLAVQNLNEIITTRANELKEDLKNKEYDELVEILSNVKIIKQSAPDNQFINEILNTLSPIALKRGLWSEPDLKERFRNVKSVCRKVALIDERGGTLFKYFISYLQSKVVLRTQINSNVMNDELQLEGKDLNTFKLLDYAQYYLEQGDFEMAIKLLQQLEGEPKRIAKNWIDEAILLLEVKQATRLIMSHISSVYIGTNLK